MSQQFETWLAIKPEIENNKDILETLKHCFEHKYEGRKIDEGINITTSTRNIYTGIGNVINPITEEEINLALKLGEPDNCSVIRTGHPNIRFELGALEQYTPKTKYDFNFKRPEFMSIIRSPEHKIDGLLTIDLTENGKYDLVPINNIPDCVDGDFVARINKETQEREYAYIADGKRKMSIKFLEIGKKYFQDGNIITL